MSFVEINKETCNKCGLCAAECPGHLLVFFEGKYPRPLPVAETFCIRCGHCVAVCPTGSLSHQASPMDKSIMIKKDLNISAEQCEQLLKSRRTVRAFKNQPVSRDMVARLIEDARYAPTGHNEQELEWLVIDSKSELDKIEELGIGWMEWAIQNDPQGSAMLNMEMMLKMQKQYHNVLMRNAPVLVVTYAAKGNLIAQIDSSTALGYLDLAANSLGLGTCWGGFVYIMASFYPPMQEYLHLPENQAALGCLMLGYNKHKYIRIPIRKEPKIEWR